MRTINYVTGAERSIWIAIWALSAACPADDTQGLTRNSSPSSQVVDSGRHGGDTHPGSRDKPGSEGPDRTITKSYGSEPSSDDSPTREEGRSTKDHHVTLIMTPRRQCRLDTVEYRCAARDVFERAPSGQESTWASILVPVLDVTYSGAKEITSGDVNGASSSLIEVLSGGKIIGFTSPNKATKILLSSNGERSSAYLPLRFEVLSEGPALSLFIETRYVPDAHQSLEISAVHKEKQSPSFTLSFTQESRDRAHRIIDAKTRGICANLMNHYEQGIEIVSALGIQGAVSFDHTHENLIGFCEQSDILSALWSAVNSDWLYTLADLPTSNGHSLENAQDPRNAASYELHKALLERHIIELQRVYREVEIFFSLLDNSTSTKQERRRLP